MTKRKVYVIKKGTREDRAKLAQKRKEFNQRRRWRASTPTIADAIGTEMVKQLREYVNP